jgi:hypothetical protein
LLKNNVRTTLIQAFGGILLLIGVVFTIGQLRISREQLRASLAQQEVSSELSRATLESSLRAREDEAWTRAIDQLGSESLPTRLGGIASLERLAASASSVRDVVMEVLTAYIRESVPRADADSDENPGWWGEPSSTVAVDVQLTLRVLGRLRPAESSSDEIDDATDRSLLDFDSTALRGAKLALGHYEGATFRRTDLREANLSGGFFEFAVFFRAIGMRANFAGNFVGATFVDSSMESADFHGADLYGASFANANLSRANFVNSNICEVDFSGALLDEADFTNALSNAETLWPNGFDPKARGVQVVEYSEASDLDGE